MSDYLENLAIRNTAAGRDVLVQPRLPAMYEALAPSPDSSGDVPPSVSADQEAHAPLRPGESRETRVNRPVEIQPPAVLLSEEGGKAIEADPPRSPVRPLEVRGASPTLLAPDADDTPETGLPVSPVAVPRRPSTRPPAAPLTAQRPLDLTGPDSSGSQEVVESQRSESRKQVEERATSTVGAAMTAQPLPDLTEQDQLEAEAAPQLPRPKITRPNEQSPRYEHVGSMTEPAALQRPLIPAEPDGSDSKEVLEVLQDEINQPDEAGLRYAQQPLAHPVAAQRPLDLRKQNPSASEGRIERRRREVTQASPQSPRGERSPSLTEPEAAAAQRLPNSTGLGESRSEGRVEAHPPVSSRPDAERLLNSTEQIQIEREVRELQTSPLVPGQIAGQRHSSPASVASSNTSGFQARQPAEGQKETTPESVHAFVAQPSRPSLQMPGPVPAFFPPARGRARNEGAPAGQALTAAQQPPVVRVSIGRVEVRAIMPPAPAKPAAPTGPRLSLDDYLQRQNEAKG